MLWERTVLMDARVSLIIYQLFIWSHDNSAFLICHAFFNLFSKWSIWIKQNKNNKMQFLLVGILSVLHF